MAASGTEAATTLPDACSVLSASEVQITSGLPSTSLAPQEKTAEEDGSPAHVCTYTHGKLTLSVTVAPAVVDNGGFGGPPGMVVKKQPGLGPKGVFVYDNEPKDQFAVVDFVAGPYFYTVRATGLANAKVLAAGRYVYRNV